MTEPEQPRRTDPVVDRVNDLVTTFLDALATLALAAGAWVWGEHYLAPGASWAVAAVVIMLLSALAQHRGRPRRPAKATAHERPYVPGPSDPGPVHIAGGR